MSKTQCGWMALGGLLCLFSFAVVWNLQDNAVSAQDGKARAVVPLASPPAMSATKSSEAKVAVSPPPAAPDTKDKADLTSAPAEATAIPLATPAVKPPAAPTMPKDPPALSLPIPISSGTTPATAIPIGLADPVVQPEQIVLPPSSAPFQEVSVPAAGPRPVGVPYPTTPTPPASVPPPVSEEIAPGYGVIGVALPSLPAAAPSPAPSAPVVPVAPLQKTEFRSDGEPPLAPHPGPVVVYRVRREGETPRDIARKALGTTERCDDVIKLNPKFAADSPLSEGCMVKLPADACIPTDEVDTVKPLPIPRKPAQIKVRELPLTGTFPCNLDEKRNVALPRAIRAQLGNCDTLLVSPGPDHCLWVTNQAQLDRLAERLDQSPAKEIEVRVFKRLYFAQTERVAVTAEGRLQISERLAQFAGLNGEVVLLGIDDHFELWDVNRWKSYTQQQSLAASKSGEDSE